MELLLAAVHRVAFWILLAFFASAVIRLILMLDINKRVYNHTPGPCRIVFDEDGKDVDGSAGIHFVRGRNLALITYGYANAFENGSVPSGLASFEFKKGEEQTHHRLKKLDISWNEHVPKHFAPLGLTAFENNGRVLTYVVNSHPKAQCVHFFTLVKSSLQHRKALCDSRFTSLRDIAAVDADRFFVTNLGYFSQGHLQTVELALQSSLGLIYFYDGRNFSVAVSNFPTPSALAIDEKKRLLYVSSLLNEFVRVYEIGRDNTLKQKVDISLLASPVGLHVDYATGDLWAACHPVLLQAFIHQMNPSDKAMKSPSQVLRVRIQEDGISWVVTEPYANDGATISGSNAVTFAADQMLVGSLFERLLHCDILNPQIT
ncbi:unnamed protein product [Caenorhabditis auriculariae]|uniref:Paraoxonase n=1 Tax=Caenorhabditis auriculariae TaxID=2777116 RepID=A0A8S1H696_9PELO|nr:unnamed protein product [Caenorhabditis auriculariae]